MSKRLLIAAGFILFVAAAGAMTLVSGPSTPATQPLQRAATPKRTVVQKPWNGIAARYYDASFIHSGQVLNLRKMGFTGLDRPSASASFAFTTDRIPTGVPRFVRSENFTLVSENGRRWLPTLRAALAGAQVKFTLSFVGLPTRQLAAGKLELQIASPSGRYALVPLPPRPPAGHGYAEKPAKKALKAKPATKPGKKK